MNNLITTIDKISEVLESKLKFNDKQLVYCREDNRLYMKDNENLIDILLELRELVSRPIEFRTLIPDYENIGSENIFTQNYNDSLPDGHPIIPWNANPLSYKANHNGYVLITIEGLTNFRICHNGTKIIEKEVDKKKPNTSILYAQTFEMAKDDVIEVHRLNGVDNIADEDDTAKYSCYWVPPRVMHMESGYIRDEKKLVDLVYPIGSIYITVNPINPHYLFGGVWKMFSQGRTLLGFNDNIEEWDVKRDGSLQTRRLLDTGGRERVKLEKPHMPNHDHDFREHNPEDTHTDFRYHKHTFDAHEYETTKVNVVHTWENAASVEVVSNIDKKENYGLTKEMWRVSENQDFTVDSNNKLMAFGDDVTRNTVHRVKGDNLAHRDSFDLETGTWADDIKLVRDNYYAGGDEPRAEYETENTRTSDYSHIPHNFKADGGDRPHENMMPYVVTYIWERKE